MLLDVYIFKILFEGKEKKNEKKTIIGIFIVI